MGEARVNMGVVLANMRDSAINDLNYNLATLTQEPLPQNPTLTHTLAGVRLLRTTAAQLMYFASPKNPDQLPYDIAQTWAQASHRLSILKALYPTAWAESSAMQDNGE